MTYTLGSLFDGSGGFPLAGTLCGIVPKWAAEVEPYPIAVTRSRFPNMEHFGDVGKINGAEIEPVDIITFGSPCQDLSVAGKRAGLKHEANGDEETTRSGLFMEAVRIIKEMREATNGRYPSFALWENVPGAFSSNGGEDFRIVCEELIKIVEPTAVMPSVPASGWAYADSYIGDGWSLAYRVFDAQYWGVPQRRRRIHLVLDLRGERAREVLFEREGLRGYFAQSGEARQGTAADAEGGSGADDREIANGGAAGERGLARLMDAYQHHGWRENDICGTLTAGQNESIRGDTPLVCFPAVANALVARADGSPQPDKGSGANVVEALPFNTTQITNPHNGNNPKWGDPCHTLAATDHPPAVICLQGSMVGRSDKNGPQGDGVNGETCFTLNTIDRHAVVYSVGNGQMNQISMAEQCNTLDCMHDKQAVLIAHGVNLRAGIEYPELYPTLQAKSTGGHSLNYSGACRIQYIVRRLTPTECARLQGFADCWGWIDEKDSFTAEELQFWTDVRNTHAAINGKTVKDYTETQMLNWYNKLHTDSAEYKMWGNGIALPPALYCMQGITDALKEVENDWML